MSLTMRYDGHQLKVAAGRVTEIDVGAAVRSVIADPAGGNVTLNPNGTLALVLPDPGQLGTTSFTVRLESGAEMKVDLRVEGGTIDGGWAPGEHYGLETGTDDRSIIETGENHRKVYITESGAALSRADIAAREGIRESAIDGEWLAAHPEYGASEGMALDTDAGMALWFQITGRYTEPASHHLLFEKDYTYKGTGRLIDRGTMGESALHPILVGAWGNGEKPVIDDRWMLTQELSENIVLQGLDFAKAGSVVGSAKNLLIEDVILRNYSTVIQSGEQITLRNAEVLDVSEHQKTSGLFARKSEGLLVENVLADLNGWELGWETDKSKNAPKTVNHNIYIQWDNSDVTVRDNVSLRGSSFGAQIRSGGVVEGNAFLDNNVALNVQGGNDRTGDYIGNYALILDNVVSSGAHKVAPGIGGLTWGVQNLAPDSSLSGNIIAHLADPADPEERAEKTEAPNDPLKHKFAPFVDDTIIYNWVTDDKRDNDNFNGYSNVPDIAASILDKVTLRRFIEEARDGKDPGDVIDTLANWLRANWFDHADASDIVDFFQEGFGIDREVRTAPQTLRFAPDARGDGMRADNRLNWTGEGLPQDGDSLDLAGNWVTWAGTTDIKNLDLGTGGVLTVRQGRLDTAGLDTGTNGKIAVGLAGQFWTKGHDGAETLTVEVTGGRFANTGTFSGPVDLSVSGGEVLVATAGATFLLDGRLAITGSAAEVGYDGQGGGAAVLSLMPGAELFFAPDALGISAIREFRSGSWGLSAPNVASTLDLGDGDTTLALNVNAVKGTTSWHTLAQVDTLTGGFGEIVLTGNANTRVSVKIDYATDRIELATAAGASGAPRLVLAGSAAGDVFVVAAGVSALIENYAADDVIDLSAAIDAGSLADLAVLRGGGKMWLVRESSDTVLAVIADATADQVRVRADGLQVRIAAKDGDNLPDPGDDGFPPPVPDASGKLVVRDDLMFIPEDGDERIRVLNNDTNPDGTSIWVDSFTQGAHGSVQRNGGGRLVYTADAGFTGTDSFTYTARDEEGDTATAKVTVKVPYGVESGGRGAPTGPVSGDLVARDDSVVIPEDGNQRIHVVANDVNPDGTAIAIHSFTQPDHGTVTSGGGGRLVYTADAGFAGTDRFTYRAVDGESDTATAKVTVAVPAYDTALRSSASLEGGGTLVALADRATVAQGGQERIHVLGNDTDPDDTDVWLHSFTQAAHGSVERGGGGRLTYTADAGFAGTDTFTYTAMDEDGDTAIAMVAMLVVDSFDIA